VTAGAATEPAAGRVALVTGAAGQDGFYLVERLLREGSAVHATVREISRATDLTSLPGGERLTIHELDLIDADAVADLVASVRPAELYNLAGQTSVGVSYREPGETWQANATAVATLLEAVRRTSPETVLYQSSSIEMFGGDSGAELVHDERSALRPMSPYAASKAAAHVLCDAYRRAFDLRIACGILANHESRRRPASFLTRKVVDYVRALREGRAGGQADVGPLPVGNLAVRRDWGFAPDFVEGIIRVCRQVSVRAEVAGGQPEPDIGSSYRDYVLATGELHAVWELIDRAFELAGLPLAWDRSSADLADWSARIAASGRLAVVVDPALLRPGEPAALGADPSRARTDLGWQARGGLDAFLKDMLEPELANAAPGSITTA